MFATTHVVEHLQVGGSRGQVGWHNTSHLGMVGRMESALFMGGAGHVGFAANVNVDGMGRAVPADDSARMAEAIREILGDRAMADRMEA